MASSAKNSNGFFGPSIGLISCAEPMPNLAGSLSSLVGQKSNWINGVGWFAAELLPNWGGVELRTSGWGAKVGYRHSIFGQ